jgi:GMP synthase (glutamine-hydrolysing)
MTSVLAIRHVHFEDLGSIEPLFRERGYEVRYVDATTDGLVNLDPSESDLMVFLGGPIGAFDDATYPFIVHEVSLMRRRLEAKLPVVGICLGAQLMARAMGAKVYPMGVKEIGFSPLTLTSDGADSPLSAIGDTPVLHWHGDQFDIPPGATRLAGTAICPNQAFSAGHYALGLQFHIEADLATIERWLVGHANELGQARIDPRAIRDEARQLQGKLAQVAVDVMKRWLDAARLPDAPIPANGGPRAGSSRGVH